MQSIFKALASEPRIKILQKMLEEKEPVCYCELTDTLERDRSVIFRHFNKLEDANIIETHKEGKKLHGKVKEPQKIKDFLDKAEEIKNGD